MPFLKIIKNFKTAIADYQTKPRALGECTGQMSRNGPGSWETGGKQGALSQESIAQGLVLTLPHACCVTMHESLSVSGSSENPRQRTKIQEKCKLSNLVCHL